MRDLTRVVSYDVQPAGVLSIDATGLVVPLADGAVTITARSPEGVTGSTKAQVLRFGNEALVNFPNQIVPIFTKLSCNSGGCHGKSSGQNGFKLSLLGFEPREDYEHLVKEGAAGACSPLRPTRACSCSSRSARPRTAAAPAWKQTRTPIA